MARPHGAAVDEQYVLRRFGESAVAFVHASVKQRGYDRRTYIPGARIEERDGKHVRVGGPNFPITAWTRTGWPFLALQCHSHERDGSVDHVTGYEVTTSKLLPNGQPLKYAIAFQPLWPGFLGNVLVYAGAV